MLTLFLLVLALVLFLLAAIGTPDHPRLRLVPAGLFCLTLAYLVSAFPHHL